MPYQPTSIPRMLSHNEAFTAAERPENPAYQNGEVLTHKVGLPRYMKGVFIKGVVSGLNSKLGGCSAVCCAVKCVQAVAMATVGDAWDLFGSASEEGDSIADIVVSAAGEIPPNH